jgi:hypothetical protein
MAVRPVQGEILRETKITTIEPAEEKSNGKRQQHPPMWDFIDSLTPEQWASKEYEITLYRGTKNGDKVWCGKFYEPIDPERIKRDFGGGSYNLWMKVPPARQLRYNEDIQIAGSPKEDSVSMPLPTDPMGQMMAMMRDELKALREELRTSRGGDLGLEAVKQALALNGTVFSSAATAATGTLQRLAGGDTAAVHPPNPMDDLMRQFMTAAIAKMMNPADPIENFAKMAQAMAGIGFKMGGNAGGEKLVDKLALGLVNQLPVLTQHVAGIMDGYRRAEEAKLNTVALTRGVPPPINVAPVQQRPTQQPGNVITLPTPQPETQPANGQPTQEQLMQAEQMMQYIEQKIAEILSNQALTPQEAAVQALTFIDVTDPVGKHPNGRNLIDEILQHGKTGLDWIFSNRPILQEIPKDDRLEAFKLAFIENGRPVPVPENMQPNPSTPPA